MTLLPTSLVGSYPQPDWLIDREALGSHVPARVRARELWRVDERWLREAQDDTTLLAIRDQERAGLDIVTDGGVLDALDGKTVILGVIALDTAEVETPETVAERIRRALPHKGADELIAAPDCGMKYLPREAAFAKLEALVAGAELVRSGLAG